MGISGPFEHIDAFSEPVKIWVLDQILIVKKVLDHLSAKIVKYEGYTTSGLEWAPNFSCIGGELVKISVLHHILRAKIVKYESCTTRGLEAHNFPFFAGLSARSNKI